MSFQKPHPKYAVEFLGTLSYGTTQVVEVVAQPTLEEIVEKAEPAGKILFLDEMAYLDRN